MLRCPRTSGAAKAIFPLSSADRRRIHQMFKFEPSHSSLLMKLRSRYNIFIVRICVQQIVSFCLFGLVSVFVCQDSPEYSLQNPVRTYTHNVHHMVTRTQKVNMTDLHTDAQTNNMHHCISVCTYSSSQILYIRKHHLYMFCVHARKFKSMHGSSSPYTEVQNQSLAFLTLS